MSETTETARLLGLAAQARAIAADLKDADKKRAMLDIATDYEDMATKAALAAPDAEESAEDSK
jgi:hypothetical protein